MLDPQNNVKDNVTTHLFQFLAQRQLSAEWKRKMCMG